MIALVLNCSGTGWKGRNQAEQGEGGRGGGREKEGATQHGHGVSCGIGIAVGPACLPACLAALLHTRVPSPRSCFSNAADLLFGKGKGSFRCCAIEERLFWKSIRKSKDGTAPH